MLPPTSISCLQSPCLEQIVERTVDHTPIMAPAPQTSRKLCERRFLITFNSPRTVPLSTHPRPAPHLIHQRGDCPRHRIRSRLLPRSRLLNRRANSPSPKRISRVRSGPLETASPGYRITSRPLRLARWRRRTESERCSMRAPGSWMRLGGTCACDTISRAEMRP